MKIAVIGAGIAGLSAAIALTQKGFEVEVFEQAKELRDVGAGLQISPNGTRVLNNLGVKVKHFVEPEMVIMQDGQSGRKVFSLPIKEISSERWGAKFIHIHRADLQKALLLRVNELGLKITFGKTILIDEITDLTHSFNYVIAADGVHSIARQLLTQSRPQFSGNVAYRAITPAFKLRNPPRPSAIIWAGQNQHAVTTRISGGKDVNFVGICEETEWKEDGWNHPVFREFVLEKFKNWSDQLVETIQNGSEFKRWALLYHPPLPSFAKGNLILIGDAAHPMLPSFAQGAVQALEDAYILAECLQNGEVSDFDQLRKTRVERVQRESRNNLQLYHLSKFKKTAYFGAAKLADSFAPWVLIRRLDWLYGYDVKSVTQSYF